MISTTNSFRNKLDLPMSKYGLEPGDVVAFKGEGFISDAIMKLTGCNVSHVGMIYGITDEGEPMLVESTTLAAGEPAGVMLNPLTKRVHDHLGSIWILPLRHDLRAAFDLDKYHTGLWDKWHDKYDKLGVGDFFARKWLGLRMNPFPGHIFCSCLVSYGLEAAGVLPKTIYPRNEAPSDVTDFSIYSQSYYQVKGDAGWEDIKNFNTKVTK